LPRALRKGLGARSPVWLGVELEGVWAGNWRVKQAKRHLGGKQGMQYVVVYE